MKALNEENNLTIVAPYRDRREHLKVFLEEIPAHLAKYHPDISFKIVIVEQVDHKKFNRAKLLNIGFDLHKLEATYFAFHDVDLIPEDSSCDYSFPLIPIHLATHCQQAEYQLPHYSIFGGVVLFNKKDFSLANGYSNEYWGWGGEDDDLMQRVKRLQSEGLISGWGRKPGRYSSLPHKHDGECSPENWNRYKSDLSYGFKVEGLNSIDYTLEDTQDYPTHTLHKVKL